MPNKQYNPIKIRWVGKKSRPVYGIHQAIILRVFSLSPQCIIQYNLRIDFDGGASKKKNHTFFKIRRSLFLSHKKKKKTLITFAVNPL